MPATLCFLAQEQLILQLFFFFFPCSLGMSEIDQNQVAEIYLVKVKMTLAGS